MREPRTPAEGLTILRMAERLLIEQADQLRRHAASRADCGRGAPSSRYQQLLDTAADLGQLAAEIAVEAER